MSYWNKNGKRQLPMKNLVMGHDPLELLAMGQVPLELLAMGQVPRAQTEMEHVPLEYPEKGKDPPDLGYLHLLQHIPQQAQKQDIH